MDIPQWLKMLHKSLRKGLCLICHQPCTTAICMYCKTDTAKYCHSTHYRDLQKYYPVAHATILPGDVRLFALGPYCWPLTAMIHALKHGNKPAVGKELADWFCTYSAPQISLPQCLLPVPLARQRIAERIYNQAALIALQCAVQLKLECQLDWAIRVRNTQAQQGLDRKQRLTNLRNAFQLTGDINHSHVAIVDDVVTTGATCLQLINLLRQHAPKLRIDVWCIAVTPPELDCTGDVTESCEELE